MYYPTKSCEKESKTLIIMVHNVKEISPYHNIWLYLNCHFARILYICINNFSEYQALLNIGHKLNLELLQLLIESTSYYL